MSKGVGSQLQQYKTPVLAGLCHVTGVVERSGGDAALVFAFVRIGHRKAGLP